MSNLSPQISILSDELYDESNKGISRPPSLSRLYRDAAAYGQLLAQTDSPFGDTCYAKSVDLDLTDAESVSSYPSTLQTVQAPETLPKLAIVPQEGVLSEIEPRKLVDLIIEEFGPLEGDEEERFLFEVDACLVSGVLVLGVLHLTTHRLAFHASLCSCQSYLATPHQPLKAGVAILRRKSWHSSRRVWLELTNDMLCVYRSSSDDGKAQPIHSILLGLIDQINPVDADHPTHITLVLGSMSSITFDFETSTSSLGWRRELSGALFLFRHQRRTNVDSSNAQPNSIRISCPLDRIDLINSDPLIDVLTRLSLNISLVSSDITSDKTHPLGAQVLQLGICVLRAEALFIQLERSIAAAKHRLNVDMTKSPIFMDLGPISWAEQEVKQTANCSDLATRPQMDAQANQSQSLLWFCSAQAARSSGYLVIAPTHIGFWSKDLTHCDPRHYISLQSIETVRPFRTAIRRLNGVTIRLSGGMEGLKLAFQCAELRDEVVRRVNDRLTQFRRQIAEETLRQVHSEPLPRGHNMTSLIAPLSRSLATAVRISLPIDVIVRLPKTVNLPPDVLGMRAPLHFVCLTIGSRGDVQPYIALGLGLRQHNHRVTIVTHEEYKDWVEKFGLSHRTAGGDPGELMKLSVENKMFSPEFFRKTVQDFRSWLDELLMDAWDACQDADVLLESPSAMAGVHIAEALKIPYIRTFTMPWAKTGEFPHPFLSPFGSTAAFNSTSYILFDNLLWRSTSQQVNKWRKQVLNLDVTEMGHRAQSKLMQIYDFSQAVVPKPLDWGDNIVISGYWFLDNSEVNWNPPSAFLEWMEQARRDNKPIVYIGFGSITVPRPNLVTSRIVKAITQSGVRAIISRGWSKRMATVKDIQEVEIPPECYLLDKVPHDWLFPRIDAAMHHGGAGTTGASLRAGIPTLIKPWFGDQFFWASRIERLGAGLRVNSFRVNDISDALVRATTDQAMKDKAAQVGTRIRSEDGVHTAIYTIYTQLDKQHRNQGKSQASKS